MFKYGVEFEIKFYIHFIFPKLDVFPDFDQKFGNRICIMKIYETKILEECILIFNIKGKRKYVKEN